MAQSNGPGITRHWSRGCRTTHFFFSSCFLWLTTPGLEGSECGSSPPPRVTRVLDCFVRVDSVWMSACHNVLSTLHVTFRTGVPSQLLFGFTN